MADARGAVLMFKPRTGGKRPKRGRRARYFYPREALEQDYFTLGGTGIRYHASLGASMLASVKFESQIALLLSQLTNEGFDVSGPEAEYRALLDVVRTTHEKIDELSAFAMHWKFAPSKPSGAYREEAADDE